MGGLEPEKSVLPLSKYASIPALLKSAFGTLNNKDWTYPDAEPRLEWIDIPLRDLVAANKALKYLRITEIEFVIVTGTTCGVVMIDDTGLSI